MDHTLDTIKDNDKYFIIDPITRTITNQASAKNSVTQYDHNSEVFAFKIPLMVEGHDMSNCDAIQIHYINKGQSNSNPGIYEAEDITVITEEDVDYVVFSWLVSQNATQLTGDITFQIKFICYNETDPAIFDYVWGTRVFSAINVLPGINNTEIIVEEYADVLAQWEKRLFSLSAEGVENINTVKASSLEEMQTAKTETITEINTSKDNACAEVEQKGKNVLESIPDDYAVLSNDLKNIKNDLIGDIIEVNVESSLKYIHTPIKNNVSIGTKIIIKIIGSDFKFALYTDDGSFLVMSQDGVIIYTIENEYSGIKCVVTNNTGETVSYKYLYKEINDNSVNGDIFNLENNLDGLGKNLDEVDRKLDLKVDTPIINLFDYESRIINKSINAYGEELDSTYWDASPFILLEPNTSYFAYGMYVPSFYSFYDLNKVRVTDGYTFEKTTSDYNGLITVGDKPLYFRCTLAKNTTEPYISKYTDSYVPYGLVDFSLLSKKNTDDIEKLKRGKYYNKKVLVMGDSISVDYYGNYPKWVTVLINEGYFPKDTTNSSIHATGFVAKYTAEDPNADNDFITRIEAIQNKDEFDLVVVFGGINDFIQAIPMESENGDETTHFKPAVDYFFDYLVKNFTQARIVVLSPLRTNHKYPNTAGHKQEEYTSYIREVAKSYCFPVLNLTEESGFCPFIAEFSNRWTYTGWGGEENTKGDGVHPNVEYEEKFLAPMIRNFLDSLI